MHRATKIVATLGPASSSPEILEQMIRAGVDVVRLNFSHGKAQDHIDRATMVREVARRAGKEVAIMADLQGPKIRVGKFEGGKIMLEAGQKFVLDGATTRARQQRPRGPRLQGSAARREGRRHPAAQRRPAQAHRRPCSRRRSAHHGRDRWRAVEQQGINKAGGGLTAPALTAKDMEDIKTAMAFQCEYLAVSFRRTRPTWKWRASSPTWRVSRGATSRR